MSTYKVSEAYKAIVSNTQQLLATASSFSLATVSKYYSPDLVATDTQISFLKQFGIKVPEGAALEPLINLTEEDINKISRNEAKKVIQYEPISERVIDDAEADFSKTKDTAYDNLDTILYSEAKTDRLVSINEVKKDINSLRQPFAVIREIDAGGDKYKDAIDKIDNIEEDLNSLARDIYQERITDYEVEEKVEGIREKIAELSLNGNNDASERDTYDRDDGFDDRDF